MIRNLVIRNVATYDPIGAELKELGKINFIYGSNGSGKTTISEVIRSYNKFEDCSIEWHGTPYKSLVYNRNFIFESFRNDSTIKGIFTLGKESVELLEQIEAKKVLVSKHEEEIFKLNGVLGQKEIEESENRISFREQCWDLKGKYEIEYKEALRGVLNSKENFMDKFLTEAANNNSELTPLEELKKRKIAVFGKQQTRIELLESIELVDTFNEPEIFLKKVIGKNDVDLANLISSLKISDWVQQGHKHSKDSNGICPFCQQSLPEKFDEKLNEYFDDTYTVQLKELETASEQYQQFFRSLVEKLEEIKFYQNQYFENEKVFPLIQLIESQYNENKVLIEQKVKEPSRSILIISVQPLIDKINDEIKFANIKVTDHNALLENIKVEQTNLISDIWRLIVEENKTNYEAHKQKITKIEKAIYGIKANIVNKNVYKKTLEKEIAELEDSITSNAPSITRINAILVSFGFTNFKLADAGKGNYRIVRENGTDAEATLSEGEKTFITFLYFYQLIKGNNIREHITSDRIVVIDDPISSLDSTVLFIVSSLIRKLIDEVRNEQLSNIKQLIILTHNVYFHKEVSFNKGKGNRKLKDETFWIVRKINNQSIINGYNENPIKTSYELLWKELNYIHEDLTTKQNVMRRILENYFKFFGNINIDEEIDKFAEEDRFVCHSLLSWTNDGSHYINEDLFVESSPELTEKFLSVFKNIFINMGHESHYEMMMVGYKSKSFEPEETVI